MEGELAQLAASGAGVLVNLMVSDAWAQVRGRLAGFFGRGGHAEDAGRELALARTALERARAAGDEEAAAGIEADWRERLRRALRDDPAAAAELRALLEELAPEGTDGGGFRNTISGGVQYGPVVQGRDLSNLTFGTWTQGPAAGE
ncbi:hypothetical protein [Actinacidiphila guanduensis]|uniref:Uncharacterized protein n=1 Tax=Actinacidiphila guanduensis TaxID=310781 RepID=A0A1H0LLM8_9ACTN|nr:hypothetical protein [Actinacidiphila guanduensis]SDO68963.1 hypothetical protein SAMN05216259_111252 [Actinacidiphila guanduensis]